MISDPVLPTGHQVGQHVRGGGARPVAGGAAQHLPQHPHRALRRLPHYDLPHGEDLISIRSVRCPSCSFSS